MFHQWVSRFFYRLPSQCAVCNAWPSQGLCESCVGLFAQPCARCSRCALAVLPGMRQCATCKNQPPHIDAAYAAVSYGFPWAKLVHDFKFHDKPAWARSMATLMRSTPWVDPALDAADWVVPMPLSQERLRQRGFNQAYVLARELAPTVVRKDLLLRIRDTPAQSSLPRRERMANVQNVFAIEPLQHHQLQGKRIVLVDDVMTSGASLNAAAHTLKQAGAQHVTALVFARTD